MFGKMKKLAACGGLCALLAGGSVQAQQNLATNGSFEIDTDGTALQSLTDYHAWRFFAVGGADGSATVSAAAASDGAVGLELVRNATGAGDSALDKDADGAREIIPFEQRVYSVYADVKDGGTHGAASSMNMGVQYQNAAQNRTLSLDPGAAFETVGVNSLSDTSGTLSLRIDLADGDNSAFIDNIRIYDVTDSNRIINGGFENSASRLINWRSFDLSGAGELVASLSSDAASGSNALLLERTAEGASDGAVDMDSDRVAVLGGEAMTLRFAAKKVSGDADTRPFVQISQFDSAGAFLGAINLTSFDPGATAYQTFEYKFVANASAAWLSVSFRVGNSSGGDRRVGAYLFDSVELIRTANALKNGGFELSATGAAPSDWRFFAVSGSSGSVTVTTDSVTEGVQSAELVRLISTAGDSALDKDTTELRDPIPAQNGIYQLLLDVKDGGSMGGTPGFKLATQFPSTSVGSLNKSRTFDPSSVFETIGVTAASGTGGEASVRLDLVSYASNRSAILDNVRMLNVTRANRMLNGGFENGAGRILNWRSFDVSGVGEFSALLSSDAYSGSYAVLLTRTTVGTSDGGLDLDSDRIAVIPGETLRISYAIKKVSGPSTMRPFVSVVEYNSSAAWVGTTNIYTDETTSSQYTVFDHFVTLNASTAQFKLGFRVGNDSGSDRGIGAYLLDDVVVIRNQKPTVAAASITVAGSPSANAILRAVGSGFADADGDAQRYQYQWLKDGSPIAGATNACLTPDQFADGDQIACLVTAFDGIEAGNTIQTAPVLIEVPVELSVFMLD